MAKIVSFVNNTYFNMLFGGNRSERGDFTILMPQVLDMAPPVCTWVRQLEKTHGLATLIDVYLATEGRA